MHSGFSGGAYGQMKPHDCLQSHLPCLLDYSALAAHMHACASLPIHTSTHPAHMLERAEMGNCRFTSQARSQVDSGQWIRRPAPLNSRDKLRRDVSIEVFLKPSYSHTTPAHANVACARPIAHPSCLCAREINPYSYYYFSYTGFTCLHMCSHFQVRVSFTHTASPFFLCGLVRCGFTRPMNPSNLSCAQERYLLDAWTGESAQKLGPAFLFAGIIMVIIMAGPPPF